MLANPGAGTALPFSVAPVIQSFLRDSLRLLRLPGRQRQGSPRVAALGLFALRLPLPLVRALPVRRFME